MQQFAASRRPFMAKKKLIEPGEKLPLKLTASERTLVLEETLGLDKEHEQAIRNTPSSKPIMMSLDDLDDLGGHIAAASNHCREGKKRKKFDAVFKKIEGLLEEYTDEEPPRTIKIEDARKAAAISDPAVQIATWAAQVLVAAENLGIKKKPLEHFELAPAQRDVLLLVPGVSKAIKNKLAKASNLTVAEVASMTMALAEDLTERDARKQLAVLFVAKHLIDQLQNRIVGPIAPTAAKKRKAKAKPDMLFQLKITLLDLKPPIWRRIQTRDCTLDAFHDLLQVVMGWENSHLHRFDINGQAFGDPDLFEEDFLEFDMRDSRKTMLSQIVPKDGKRCRFMYEYDFGDGWMHEIVFEGNPEVQPGVIYPTCLEGERRCPPEDVGGAGGYQEYLEALADPSHENHKDFLQWQGKFDPESFDLNRVQQQLHSCMHRQ
jgi:hypothetical protein